MSENLTKQYAGYALYLPSLQKYYAEHAVKRNSETSRMSRIPKGFDNRWLNFLDTDSKLWHCEHVLYSSGQFNSRRIRARDIVAERDVNKTTIVGDSGGFQLGTGKLPNGPERDHLELYKNDPLAQYNNWQHCDFRSRTLRWLEKYTDYAMTLDMVLWAAEEYGQSNTVSSQLRKLTVQQLIDLSVDNLRYFSDNRGRGSTSTKFLSVLQDIGNGTGDAWYDAVKSFDFEGWSLGGEVGGMLSSLQWLRRLLNDQNLDKSEWVHLLMKSPPVNSVVYTAAQRSLRKLLGRDDFTISFDSSSPFQMAGKQRSLALMPNFTADRKTWKIGGFSMPQDIRIARREKQAAFALAPPLEKYLSAHDLYAHDIDDSDFFTDTWSEHILTNHNLYTYHQYSIQGCDLVFDPHKQDHGRVPEDLLEIVELMDSYFAGENSGEIQAKFAVLMKPYMRQNKEEEQSLQQQ